MNRQSTATDAEMPQTKRLKFSPTNPLDTTPKSCLGLFPEELWELILENVENSVDIMNAFSACPELSSLLHVNKTRWLFDQVFPHICKQLQKSTQDRRNLLACRRVSQRWCTVIDRFLENHSSRRPYNSDRVMRRNATYGEFTHVDELPCQLILYTPDISEKVNQEIWESIQNPFIGRRVSLRSCMEPDETEDFLDASILFLEKYGHHIYDLDIAIYEDISHQDAERFILKLLKCLSFTPNLRFLAIKFKHDDAANEINSADYPLPSRPNLECLDINEYFSDTVGRILAPRYNGPNVKRLGVPLACMKDCNFNHLNELCVYVGDAEEEELELFPLDFSAFPLLRKLKISGTYAKYNITQLFAQLAPLAIEELHIHDCEIVENSAEPLSPIPSIKYFRISDSLGHSFDFVKMLTSLQHLHLDWHELYNLRGTHVNEIFGRCKNPSEFSNNVRRYMYQRVVPQNVSIWNELPTLKLLTVEKEVLLTQYVRECGNKSFSLGDELSWAKI